MKKVYTKILLGILFCLSFSLTHAQVSLTATAGTTTATFATLKDAFDAVNAGTHQGAIAISVNGNTTETAPCVLNSSGAGAAAYTSLTVKPTVVAVITGATTTGRGIIELNGADNVTIDGSIAGSTRDLTISNTAANTVTFTSVIRLATSTLVLNSDNVSIKNLIITGSGTAQNVSTNLTEIATFGIIASGGASTVAVTTAPSPLASASTTIAGTQTVSNLMVDNNDIRTVSRAISVNGATATAASGVTITGNIIGNAAAGAPDQVTGIGITINGSNSGIIRGNTVRIESYYGSSTTSKGIDLGTISTVGLSGIVVNANKIDRVINSNTQTYTACGININGGTNHTVQNNFIGDCLNSQVAGSGGFSTTFGAYGIRIITGTGHRIIHNSVHFTGVVPGSISSDLIVCLCVASTASTGMDIRNNIFSNQATGGNTTPFNTVFASIYLPSGGTSALNLTLNNNSYYQGTLAYSGIAQVSTTGSAANLYTAANFSTAATTPSTNLRAYTSTLSSTGNNDNASQAFTGGSPFISATDLHLVAGAPQIDQAANAGVLTDFDGQSRPGANASFDIGADERDGLVPPANDVQATAFIDPASGGSKPAGISFSPVASFTNNGSANLTNVTVRYRILNASSVEVYNQTVVIPTFVSGITIQVTFPGVTLAPGAFTIFARSELAGDVVPANNEIGGTLTSVPPLSGSYTVGTGGDYSSLSNAGGIFSAMNTTGVGGNIVINIISDLPGETGLNALNENSGGYTVLIKPSGGGRTITGTGATSVIKLNGADRVTIDGSLAGGIDRNLTIAATTAATLVWIGTNATSGANNNTLRCVNLAGNTALTAQGVIASSGTTLGNPAEFPQNNNTVFNCTAVRVQNAVYINGNATTLDANWSIRENVFGSTTNADKLSFRGILILNGQGFEISNNTVRGVLSGTTSTAAMTGIFIGGLVSNGVVFRNKITDIKQVNTTGYGAYGIYIGPTSTNSNVTVHTNFVSDVAGIGFADAVRNGYGIYVASGTGFNIYYNSIYMNTNQTLTGSITSAFNAGTGLAAGAINLRNNIFSNVQTVGAHYAFYSASANTAFSTINYNDYYVSGGDLGFIGSARSTLTDLRTGTAQDVNSINAQPVFASATDLRLDPMAPSNSSLNNAGTPIAGIVFDIDTQTRSTTTPDIGADEFSPGVVLAVSLSYFNGTKLSIGNQLNWKIDCTSGLNITLERSADGRTFTGLNTQAATADRCLIPFNYTDATPLAGYNYYRLKMVTPDGAVKYSNIVLLINKASGFEIASINPNPVKDNAVLSLSSAKAGMIEISVTDINGKMISTMKTTVSAGTNNIPLNMSNLAKGTYQVTATSADGDKQTSRVVKY